VSTSPFAKAGRVFGVVMAVLLLVMAVGVVFFAPIEELSRTRGLRGGSSSGLFLGLVFWLGEPVARAAAGTVLVGLAWLFFRMSRK
jgi:hypothetical protein